TDEWDDPAHPDPLPMPLHTMLTAEAQTRVQRAAATPGSGAERLITYFVGQIVGSMTTVRPAAQVVQDMVEEYLETVERMGASLEG
ncbi:MAG TPA: nitronate monooxygenase, partial [Candidatus Dormibacteraeota bacterium]|nr:nitronate monooxygenase [Candidatus Dormibacteraeota bacterium]